MPDFLLTRYHGDNLILPVGLTDSEGLPIDLSGAAIKFKLGTITDTSEGYSISRDDAAGNFTITLSATLMETLTEENYNFGLEVTYPSGIKETLFVGKLILVEDIVP